MLNTKNYNSKLNKDINEETETGINRDDITPNTNQNKNTQRDFDFEKRNVISKKTRNSSNTSYSTRKHPRSLVNRAVLLVFGIILLLWLINKVGESIIKNNYASLTMFYIGIILFFISYMFVFPWLKWLTTLYTFDQRRIVIKMGILNKNINTVAFKWIINFYILQNINDKLFKTGTLIIELSNGEEVRIDTLPDIKRIERLMNNAINTDTDIYR